MSLQTSTLTSVGNLPFLDLFCKKTKFGNPEVRILFGQGSRQGIEARNPVLKSPGLSSEAIELKASSPRGSSVALWARNEALSCPFCFNGGKTMPNDFHSSVDSLLIHVMLVNMAMHLCSILRMGAARP